MRFVGVVVLVGTLLQASVAAPLSADKMNAQSDSGQGLGLMEPVKFSYAKHKTCANKADILSTLVHTLPWLECKAKCEVQQSCKGFIVESDKDTGECALLVGPCETANDTSRSLFLKSSEIVNVANTTQPSAPLNKTVLPEYTGPPMIPLSIVIPTVRRYDSDGSPAPEQYLGPLVRKLYGDLTPQQRANVTFFILNADKEPEKHTEALELAALPGVHVLNKPNYDAQLDTQLRELGAVKDNGVWLEDGRQVNEQWIHWVAAEDLDGAYLLEKGMNASPFVLFLEDDVAPTSNALTKLTEFMQSKMGVKSDASNSRDDWLFVDLYTPNLDWAPGMITVQNGDRYNFQCCTQAMLFRSDVLPRIISYWRTHASEPVDDNLRNFREKETPNMFIYAMRPNLFEHVGAYSSNPQKSHGVVEHQSLEFVPLLLQTDLSLVK